MTINMVSALEIVCTDIHRLVTVSINGWPFGMMMQALLGYATKNWLC
jgi:hypothetical protein